MCWESKLPTNMLVGLPLLCHCILNRNHQLETLCFRIQESALKDSHKIQHTVVDFTEYVTSKSPISHIKSVFCCPISQFTWLQPNAAPKSPSASGADVQLNSWWHHCCTEHFCTKIKTLKPQFVYPKLRIGVNNWCLPCTLARAHSWSHQLLARGEGSTKLSYPPLHCSCPGRQNLTNFRGCLKEKQQIPQLILRGVTHVLLQIPPNSPSLSPREWWMNIKERVFKTFSRVFPQPRLWRLSVFEVLMEAFHTIPCAHS